eukprot:276697-Pyramimonas_sp.AAC.1
MRTLPLGPSVELPMGHEALHRVKEAHVDFATVAFGGAPYIWGHEALYQMGETNVDGAIEAFGGAPCGATKRSIGWGRRIGTVPLGLSVGLPMWPRNAAFGWGRRIRKEPPEPSVGPLWGHATLYWVGKSMRTVPWRSVDFPMGPRSAVQGAGGEGDACGR